MGKDLKGRELGAGLLQKKDKRYAARITDKRTGKRIEKNFKTITDARQWLANANYQNETGIQSIETDMRFSEWTDNWLVNIKKGTVKQTTYNLYDTYYQWYIKPYFGRMKIKEIKMMDCQAFINKMKKDGYKPGTIKNARLILRMILESACQNDIILKNPLTKLVKAPALDNSERRVLTPDEQGKVVGEMQNHSYGNHFRFILETGLRISEVRGLQWSDVDWDNNCININHNLVEDDHEKAFIMQTPKSKAGKRVIPLTVAARQILEYQKSHKPKITERQWIEQVFVGNNGKPVYSITYDRNLYAIADKLKIEKFSAHTLRHTFATRCVEAGVPPKTLQTILGHENIMVTMNLYVHNNFEEKVKGMDKLDKINTEICAIKVAD